MNFQPDNNNVIVDGAVVNTLIVDDELHASSTLAQLLSNYNFVNMEPPAGSVEMALNILTTKPIDLLFLDVEMPGKSGFDLVESLNELNVHPRIVFITAFQKYAMKAIKCAAFDFLLKPIDKDDLDNLMARVSKDYSVKEEMPSKIKHLLRLIKDQKRIRFNTRHGFILIDPGEILYIQAEWNYTKIHLKKNKSELLSINLGNMEKMLPSSNFFRISRSVIINLDCLIKVDRKAKICEIKSDYETLQFSVSNNRLKELNIIV